MIFSMNNVKGFARVGNLGSKDGYLFVFTKTTFI